MFVDLPEPVEHVEPWIVPVEARLAALKRGPRRIAYFYEQADSSTFRYRVHNMVDAIGELWPEASASYFFLADGTRLDEVADGCDVLVVCRTRYCETTSRLIQRAKRRGIPVVFDIDDFVFDTRYVHLIMETLAQPGKASNEWDFWFAYVSRLGATLRLCDRAITTNTFLAGRISAFAGIDCAVVPNFMNEAQLALSSAVYEAKLGNGFARDDRLHVGYFSGSPTHKKDFALVESALARVLRRFDDVRVRLVGYMEPAGALLSHLDRIDHEPFQDHVNLQRLIGSTEINVAPLQDNVFTNCKSELKYFEAAVTGTATIATPTFTFAQSIRDGDNGRLARAHEWERAITATIEELKDRPEDYAAMAERAERDARETFGWRGMGERLKAALG